MQDKLDVIVNKLQANQEDWFLENGITVKSKDGYWVLNYNQFAPKNQYNILTRGLVIHKDGYIASCPFFRFFNYGEPTAASVNFNESSVIEKLDGSLVGVFFPDGDTENPAWHFRNLLSAHQQDRDFAIKGFVLSEEVPLLMEVAPYLDKIEFGKVWTDFTLIFEFISRANAVITKYEEEQYGLYLIGARHLPTLREFSEDDLDHAAKILKVRRPRRWNASSYEEVLEMMSGFPKDYEGFVIRDNVTGDRIKIKSEDYLKRHRLLTKLNYKNLIPLYFLGERGEIEALFPQTKQIFDEVENCYNNFVKKVYDVLMHWQSKNVSRKEVALGIVGKEPREVCAIVFKMLETVKSGQEAAVGEAVRNMRVESLIEAWKLKDDLIEDVVDEIL